MKVSTEFTPDHQAIVTVEVDEEQLQRGLQRAAQHVSKLRPIAGFRPGKAPYNLVERAVGKDILVDEAIEELSRSLYRDVLKESKIEPADAGHLDVVQKEPPILKFTIPLRPEVKLGDYHAIRIAPTAVEVSDEEVNRVLERFQRNQATIAPVARAIQKGDSVVLDIKGGVAGEPPVDDTNVRVAVGDPNQPSLPFEDQLLGMVAGESKEIDYTYPPDAENESLRDKTAHYAVTVHEIKETQLPELNDEFVQAISQFKTLDQFKGNIRDILRRQKEREEEDRFAGQVIDALAERSEIKYPPITVNHEVEHQVEHMKEDVKRLGLTWPKYLELSGRTEEQLRDEARPEAEKQVRRRLALAQFLEEDKPEVTREEVNAEIDRLVQAAEQSGGNPSVARRSYTSREGRANIELNLRMAKALGKLVSSAKGEPTSGRILTPDMVKEGSPIPTGLITDPAQVREADWPKGLERKP